jgi:aminoglycoside phosphotransferase
VPDGMRLGWRETPARVRAAIQWWLGAEVVDARTQPGGFSPGLAARLRLADGRRVFVKAIGAERAPMGPASYRAEARVTAALPPSVPAPRLLWSYDDGDWVALVLEDVDGHPPAQPWHPQELDRVLAALAALAVELTPTPVDAPAVTDKWAWNCTGWRRLAAARDRRLAELAPWAWAHLDRLAELEAGWPQAAAGTTLLHGDLRADNLLLTPDRVVLVDWPHACVGAAWIDLLFMLPSVAMQGLDPQPIFARHPVGSRVDADAVTAVLAAIAGFFVSASLEPTPPGLPTLRGFQLAQGRAALAWLRRRLGEGQLRGS